MLCFFNTIEELYEALIDMYSKRIVDEQRDWIVYIDCYCLLLRSKVSHSSFTVVCLHLRDGRTSLRKTFPNGFC